MNIIYRIIISKNDFILLSSLKWIIFCSLSQVWNFGKSNFNSFYFEMRKFNWIQIQNICDFLDKNECLLSISICTKMNICLFHEYDYYFDNNYRMHTIGIIISEFNQIQSTNRLCHMIHSIVNTLST